jgi:histidine triad (HIT) family protein
METPPEVLAAVSARIPMLSRAVLAATGAKACHVLVNSGSEAMQSVAHLHYHILPRKEGDTFRIPWNAGSLEKSQGSALAEAIRAKVADPGKQ